MTLRRFDDMIRRTRVWMIRRVDKKNVWIDVKYLTHWNNIEMTTNVTLGGPMAMSTWIHPYLQSFKLHIHNRTNTFRLTHTNEQTNTTEGCTQTIPFNTIFNTFYDTGIVAKNSNVGHWFRLYWKVSSMKTKNIETKLALVINR